MSKDPAFLFYSSDFLIGVSDLTFEERGKYITLMCLQHQKGVLSEKSISISVGTISEDLRKKFLVDDEGNLYNERLLEEANKRKKFTKSRQDNLKGSDKQQYKPNTHMKPHMENEIEDVIRDLNLILNSKYSAKTKKTKSLIIARISDGFTRDDFRQVIEYKFKQWGSDEKMKEYLRPETLFGTKFESYLQGSKIKIVSKTESHITKVLQQRDIDFKQFEQQHGNNEDTKRLD